MFDISKELEQLITIQKVKVINFSIGSNPYAINFALNSNADNTCPDVNHITTENHCNNSYYINEEGVPWSDLIQKETQLYYNRVSNLLLEYLNQGEDFLIVQAAGNHSGLFKDADTNESYGWTDTKYNGFFGAIENQEVKDRIIVVGSISNNGNDTYRVSDFSCVGERVDIFAPGEDIMTAKTDNQYEQVDGTSFAAPHVTGVAAMLWGINDTLTGAQVKELIIENYTKTVTIPSKHTVGGKNIIANPQNVLDKAYPILDAGAAVKKLIDPDNEIQTPNGKGKIMGEISLNEGINTDVMKKIIVEAIPNAGISPSSPAIISSVDENGEFCLSAPQGSYIVNVITNDIQDNGCEFIPISKHINVISSQVKYFNINLDKNTNDYSSNESIIGIITYSSNDKPSGGLQATIKPLFVADEVMDESIYVYEDNFSIIAKVGYYEFTIIDPIAGTQKYRIAVSPWDRLLNIIYLTIRNKKEPLYQNKKLTAIDDIIFANGNPITIKPGAVSGRSNIYYDSDLSTPISLDKFQKEYYLNGKKYTYFEGNIVDGYNLENISFFGGGNEANETVKSTSMTFYDLETYGWVHGGGWSGEVTGSTNIEIYGGKYQYILGGGAFREATVGSTNIFIENATIDQSIFGGGISSDVFGESKIEIGDNVKMSYSSINGSGMISEATVVSSNIIISGDKTEIMYIYGANNSGSLSASGKNDISVLGDCSIFAIVGYSSADYISDVGYGDTNININSGNIRDLCVAKSGRKKGNVNINIKGGKIERISPTFGTKINGNVTFMISGGEINEMYIGGMGKSSKIKTAEVRISGGTINKIIKESFTETFVVKIQGGSIKTIDSNLIPTNFENLKLQQHIHSIPDIYEDRTPVSSLEITLLNRAYDYGIDDLLTLDKNKLYLWLPIGIEEISIQ